MQDSPAAGRGLQPQLMLLPRYLKDGRAAGVTSETEGAGRNGCSVGFSLSSEEHVKEGLGRLKYQIA